MKTLKTNPASILHSLPHDVLTYVKTHYPKGLIINVVEDDDRHGEAKCFDVELADADTTCSLHFDENGKFVSEETDSNNAESFESMHDPNVIEPKEPTPSEEYLDEF